MSEEITVHAAGRGNPYINLSGGHELSTRYSGPVELTRVLERNEARPLSLCSAEFDEDGVPNLISAIVQWVPTARSYRLSSDNHFGRLLFFDSDVCAESIEKVQQIADVLTQDSAPHDCRCEGWMRFIP